MFSFPIQILPADIAAETAALNAKLAKGINNLTNLTDDDIDIGSTPKDVIFEQDGIKVYHYHALVEPSKIMKTPLLIVPPLINGYEVADLQPDRSLVRNLLNQLDHGRRAAGQAPDLCHAAPHHGRGLGRATRRPVVAGDSRHRHLAAQRHRPRDRGARLAGPGFH